MFLELLPNVSSLQSVLNQVVVNLAIVILTTSLGYIRFKTERAKKMAEMRDQVGLGFKSLFNKGLFFLLLFHVSEQSAAQLRTVHCAVSMLQLRTLKNILCTDIK